MRDLDYYYNLVYKTIIHHQDPVTGLLPAHQISGCEDHAWIRDNVYSIMSVWALSMAYRSKSDYKDNRARSYMLEKSSVRCMRGLLEAMLRQREKVEKFKSSLSEKDALHAKFSSKTGKPVVDDDQWGHLQMDAISLYLLTLAQMTASGLRIVFTLDEVAFVQNLVFYVETAYFTPDFGVWERGAKSNQGVRELNASSIGMAKAALESLNKLDLFGAEGSTSSVIHTMPDEAVRCSAVLESLLPRESLSKETDAAILAVIGFPAFAVTLSSLVELTLDTIQTKLGGRFGLKRFLRDGYKTLKEDTNRLHYESWELRVFDNIECEWPLFYCYLAMINIFTGDISQAEEFCHLLDELSVAKDGSMLVPELYLVPEEGMSEESVMPGTTERVPGGRCPFMWAQSLHVISKLLLEKHITTSEIDPLNRRISALRKPEVIVQVVVLAEDATVQRLLADQGINLPTCQEISPILVKPAAMLSKLFSFLGQSKKLGLSGRKNSDVGILTTSKLYKIQDKTFVFTPQSFDRMVNYVDTDPSLAMSTLAYGLNYLSTTWTDPGRPTITLIMPTAMIEEGQIPSPVVTTLRKLASGYINGTGVVLGSHDQFHHTSCITDLAFLADIESGEPGRLMPEVERYLDTQLVGGEGRGGVLGRGLDRRRHSSGGAHLTQYLSGSMKRSRSICPDQAAVKAVHKHFQGAAQGEGGQARSVPVTRRTRLESEASYIDSGVEELVGMLRSTNDMEVHGDILHYMAITYGISLKTSAGVVKDLLRELYESACVAKKWSIVRHTHGLLGKKMHNLALSLTDLLVRQKQVTVGLPPNQELIISQPIGSSELRDLISSASKDDISAATLSQEILIYLGMFVRTEPSLFHGMLRLRIGLILQVMTSEISRSLNIDGNEATDKLLNLSPFETKNLLHNIMSGKEYNIDVTGSRITVVEANSDHISLSRKLSLYPTMMASQTSSRSGSTTSLDMENCEDVEDRTGMWARRRLLDGSLNRVPPGFYTRLWSLLLSCQGLCVQENILYQTITQEMTSGEIKFHLHCEALLNTVPEPAFRQLVVEALLVLILVVEYKVVPYLGGVININDIVRSANQMFLEDPETEIPCCQTPLKAGQCGGESGLCLHFYDSAPTGPYGTFSYLVRAVCNQLNTIPDSGDIDCNLM